MESERYQADWYDYDYEYTDDIYPALNSEPISEDSGQNYPAHNPPPVDPAQLLGKERLIGHSIPHGASHWRV